MTRCRRTMKPRVESVFELAPGVLNWRLAPGTTCEIDSAGAVVFTTMSDRRGFSVSRPTLLRSSEMRDLLKLIVGGVSVDAALVGAGIHRCDWNYAIRSLRALVGMGLLVPSRQCRVLPAIRSAEHDGDAPHVTVTSETGESHG